MQRKKPAARKPAVRARQTTPRRLSKSMRCDGLVLQVGAAGIAPKDALKLAKKIVDDNLPGDWNVAMMGTDSRDVIVRRPATAKNPTVAQAFDLAYKLREHRDIEDAEPSLFQPNMMPGDMPAMQAELARSFSSSSAGSDTPVLPCTALHDWAIDFCRVKQAWALTPATGGRARGAGIVIGHPDTGYTDHPELDRGRVLKSRGRDFEAGDADPRDMLDGRSAGHGTSTGSVIISSEAAGPVVSGVAPQAKLVPLRVTTNVVLLSFGKLAEAIRYAADDGQHVLSISLGGPFGSRFLRRAVTHAISRGVIVVAAAGNQVPFVVYPAKLADVIAVAACNCQSQPWAGSSFGGEVDITAPGESVWRALARSNGFSVQRSSGTSYATAITAGAAALWLAHHGRDNLIRQYGIAGIAAVFKEVLVEQGCDRPANWDSENFGPGILNVQKLLRASLPSTVAAGGTRGLRVAALPRQMSQVDKIAALFPEADPAGVRERLMQILETDPSQLAAKLRDVGDEIAYQAAVSPAFRNTLAGARSRRNGFRSTAARNASSRLPTLSKKLKQMMK